MSLIFSLWVPAPLQWCWVLGVLWLRAQCAQFSHDIHLHPHRLVTTSQPLLPVVLGESPLVDAASLLLMKSEGLLFYTGGNVTHPLCLFVSNRNQALPCRVHSTVETRLQS